MDIQQKGYYASLVGSTEKIIIEEAGKLKGITGNYIKTSGGSFAGLDKNIFLVGQGNKFELWDEQSWQRNCESWLDEETNSDEGDSLLDSLKI